MNKYKVIQIVCWSVGIIVLVGLAIWFLAGNKFSISLNNNSSFMIENLNGPYEEKGRYSVSQLDINNINIDWIAGGVTVDPYDGSDIKIIEYAQRELDEDEVIYYEVDTNTLKIKFTEFSPGMFSRIPPKRLEILIPEDIVDNIKGLYVDNVSSSINICGFNLENANISTVSGTCKITDVMTDEFKVKTTSGDINIDNVQSSDAVIKTVSGDIEAYDFITDELTSTTTSGDMNMENTKINSISFTTVSGNFVFDGRYTQLSGKSTSGNCNITNRDVPEAFNIKTVSGDVKLSMPAFDQFDIRHNTVSGDFKSAIPFITSGSSEKFIIKTTSGDVEIYEIN